MATLHNRRTLITKRLLREALLELLQSAPITKITIKQVCDLAEMSRSTFYLHYQDQYELLKDIENEVIQKTFESLSAISRKSDMVATITAFLEYVKANQSTFGVLLCNDDNKNFQRALMLNVQEYVRSVIPSVYDKERERILYSFIMNGSLSMIVDWMESGFQMQSNELAKLIFYACNSIIRGLPS